MFYKTKVNILNGSFAKIGEAPIDLQPFNLTMTFEDKLVIDVTKRAFSDILEVDISCYVEIGTILFKIMDIKKWDDYMELYLYECEVGYAKH